MKRGMKFVFCIVFVSMLLLSVPSVSAFSFSGMWQKISGFFGGGKQVQMSPEGGYLSSNVKATPKYVLTCEKNYTITPHSGSCSIPRCGAGKYIACKSSIRYSGMSAFKYYSEVCLSTYKTACSANPVCQVGYAKSASTKC